ncbi:MAG: DUF2520 domain-containing protein [Bacteroidota bacterium]
MKSTSKIVIIGAGNVATHLGKELKIKFSKNINFVDRTADIFIIAVKDDAIDEVAKKINIKNKIIVHTSGSVDMNILRKYSENYGVLYPLQTISKERKLNFEKVPICIEANNKQTEKILFSIGKSISKNVYCINSEKRKILHLAAVFACNFTNHMYFIAEQILKKEKLSFDILKPLIEETAKKILNMSPADAQTGPAKRNDKKILQHHFRILSKNKYYREIYRIISNNIIRNS